MNFLNEYAISVITVSLLAVLLENLLPEGGSKKYTSVIIGLFVMLVILKPMTRLPHYDTTFAIPEQRLTDNNLTATPHPYVAEMFEKKLALTICEDIKNTFGITAGCRVSCRMNESGQITDIRHITLSGVPADVLSYVAEKYDTKEVYSSP